MHQHQALPFCALGGLLMAAVACGSSASTVTNVTAPSSTRCQTSVTNSASSFGPDGGTGTLTIGASRECAWSASSRSAWIAITSGAQGQGDGTITYRVAENADPVGRQGALAVGDREVGLAQQAAPCRFAVSAGQGEPLPADGADVLVDLRTHALCDWTAASEVSWAAVAPASGRGAAAVRVIVDPNPGAERPVEVIVAGERVAIVQHARTTPPPPAPPSPAPPPPAPPPPAPTPSPSPTPTPDPTPAPSPSPPVPGPTPVRQVEIEGRIQALQGSCPALTFRIGGQTIVYTTAETRFRDVSCAGLRNNMEVEIEGTLMSDGTVRADRIERD
jgi:hypothetical protein